jgi:hypothetical protein
MAVFSPDDRLTQGVAGDMNFKHRDKWALGAAQRRKADKNRAECFETQSILQKKACRSSAAGL